MNDLDIPALIERLRQQAECSHELRDILFPFKISANEAQSLIDALASLAQPPREPTEAMLNAGQRAYCEDWAKRYQNDTHWLQHIFRAMYDAATAEARQFTPAEIAAGIPAAVLADPAGTVAEARTEASGPTLVEEINALANAIRDELRAMGTVGMTTRILLLGKSQAMLQRARDRIAWLEHAINNPLDAARAEPKPE